MHDSKRRGLRAKRRKAFISKKAILTSDARKKLGLLVQTFSMRSKAMWFVIRAAEGLPRAFTALGYIIDTHPQYKLLKKQGQPAYWYAIGARLGDPVGAYNLGLCYQSGEGVLKDINKAVFWWKRAASKYPAAGRCLGWAYRYGTGVRRDYKKAATLLARSSRAGDKMAGKMLREMNSTRQPMQRPCQQQ